MQPIRDDLVGGGVDELNKKFIADLITTFTVFEHWWYSPRLGQYADDPNLPTLTDFINWLSRNQN